MKPRNVATRRPFLVRCDVHRACMASKRDGRQCAHTTAQQELPSWARGPSRHFPRQSDFSGEASGYVNAQRCDFSHPASPRRAFVPAQSSKPPRRLSVPTLDGASCGSSTAPRVAARAPHDFLESGVGTLTRASFHLSCASLERCPVPLEALESRRTLRLEGGAAPRDRSSKRQLSVRDQCSRFLD